MAGVAAQMIAGKDIPTATTDYISDQMAVSNFPVGSSNNVRNSSSVSTTISKSSKKIFKS